MMVGGGGDESGQHFSFDNVDDDDDDYDNGSYGTGGIVHPGTVANFANFDEVSFPGSFDFAFNADGSRVENFADFSAQTFNSACATATTTTAAGSMELFADFNAAGGFTVPAGPEGSVAAAADLFADFGASSSNAFDDITDRPIPVAHEQPASDT